MDGRLDVVALVNAEVGGDGHQQPLVVDAQLGVDVELLAVACR
jgi:hypothetical protein